MSMTSTTVGPRGRGLFRLLAGGLLTAAAASVIAMPVANAQCDQTVGDSINSYLQRHPDVKQRLSSQSQAEGGGPNVLDYLSRHPDVRQHLIDLSQQCTP
jgi:Ni/Co efflux regulator RcnB